MYVPIYKRGGLLSEIYRIAIILISELYARRET